MKKVVLKVELHDEKGKQKAIKAVSTLPGINSIMVELKEKKMTVIGEVDPIEVVEKLRKLSFAEILTVGAPKEEPQTTKEPNITACGYPITHYYVQTLQEHDPNTCALC